MADSETQQRADTVPGTEPPAAQEESKDALLDAEKAGPSSEGGGLTEDSVAIAVPGTSATQTSPPGTATSEAAPPPSNAQSNKLSGKWSGMSEDQRRFALVTVGCAVAAVLLVVVVGAVLGAEGSPVRAHGIAYREGQRVTTMTQCGKVRGTVRDGVFVFTGE